MEKWEYKSLIYSLNPKRLAWVEESEEEKDVSPLLNELGEEGWELVSVDNRQNHLGLTISKTFWLKRKKSSL